MEKKQADHVKQTMARIYTQIAEKKEDNTEISNITYYKELTFGNANFIENELYVTKLEKNEGKEKIETFEIYNENGELIANVNKEGKIQFTPEYIEKLKQEYKQYFKLLKLDEATLEQPKKLEENDILLEHDELEKEVEKQQEKDKENKKEQNEQKEIEEKDNEEQIQEIANKKGVPTNNVLKVRENSNLYKDHPELEKNLIFSRDNNGIVKAEYIDENGDLQPSKYIMQSTTALRQETVTLGNDGENVTKETPYQVMQTKNMVKRDEDVRDVRINIKIDMYGYLDIEEARQGKNGEWASHDIEVRGRDYNKSKINEETSIRTGKANPDNETKAYNKAEKTELLQNEIQFDQMYLMKHSSEIIESFIKEGYQKNEAIAIFNYMIGEEELTEKEAKERVNEQIKEQKTVEKENNEQELTEEQENEEERTPWGDAEARRKR